MTRLSCRQYPMLRTFAEKGGAWRLPLEDAKAFDQRPFRSMLIQKWITFQPGRGFHITPKGKDAWHEFLNTEIQRQNPLAPLTRYFDETAYHLKPRVIPRRGAAA